MVGLFVEELVLASHNLNASFGGGIEVSSFWASGLFRCAAVASSIIGSSSWAARNLNSSLHTCPRLGSVDGPLPTTRALLRVQVPDGSLLRAADALLPVEERSAELAVCDIVVSGGPLEIFLDHIIQSLVTQDPVGRVEVGLPDGGGEDGLLVASLFDD